MRTNYHTHTYRCKHAKGTEEDYVLAAIEANLSILGFSDHAPYPDDHFDMRMDFKELMPYLNTVHSLKEKYQKEITLYCGLEIEYDPREATYYQSLLANNLVDYLLLGQHYYIDPNGIACNIYELENTQQYVAYARSLVEGMKSGYFKAIAHPDVIFYNDLLWDSYCEEACTIIVDAAKALHFPIELNANGLRRGKRNFVDGARYCYPHKKFWEKVSDTTIPVIINSDCHEPNQVYDDAIKATESFCTDMRLHRIEKLL